MSHLKSYKLFEATDVKELTFKTYFDKMSVEDRIKMDSLLEKEPKKWSEVDKSFMRKMSRKNVTLFVGSDGIIYTSEDLKKMGYNPEKLEKPSSKNKGLSPDTQELIDTLKQSLKKSKELSNKYKEEYEFTKIVNPIVTNLDMAIYHLNKFI